MALRDQFEPLSGAILHRSPLPSVDGVVHELIAKETRLNVHHISPPVQSVFATSSVLRSQTLVSSALVLLLQHLILFRLQASISLRFRWMSAAIAIKTSLEVFMSQP